MCFSPEASFTTAAITGLIGLVCVTRTRTPLELPLAIMPLCFAAQQAVEGLLWLVPPDDPAGPVSRGLVLAFLLVSQVFWPVFAPLTVLAAEPPGPRRRIMLGGLVLGLGVSDYLLWTILARPFGASIIDDHIVYATRHTPTAALAIGIAYMAAVCLPMLLSTRLVLATLGTIILAGCATAFFFYWTAFVSVWCYFAAAASAVILLHFEWERRRRPAAIA